MRPAPEATATRPAMVERPVGLALATDLYQLTMGASYGALGMHGRATFSLFVRKLPVSRPFLVVAGLAGWMSLTTGLLLNEGSAALIILNGLRMLRPGRGETRRARTSVSV